MLPPPSVAPTIKAPRPLTPRRHSRGVSSIGSSPGATSRGRCRRPIDVAVSVPVVAVREGPGTSGHRRDDVPDDPQRPRPDAIERRCGLPQLVRPGYAEADGEEDAVDE